MDGAVGPAGPVGPIGPAGPAGADGVAADVACTADQIVIWNGIDWVCKTLVATVDTQNINVALGNGLLQNAPDPDFFVLSGMSNVAIGFDALLNNTKGYENTAVGVAALRANTEGFLNTAIGLQTLERATESFNTALGRGAMRFVTLGSDNTALGDAALRGDPSVNTTQAMTLNTAVGSSALADVVSASANVAVGHSALTRNSIGGTNTAVGVLALSENISGDTNQAYGHSSLLSNQDGNYNNGFGGESLVANTSGSRNVGIGNRALASNVSGSNNTAVGDNADVAAGDFDNATAIGAGAIVNASDTVQLGNTFLTSVATSGSLTTGAVTYPNTDGMEGQVLATNGSGIVGWIEPDSGASAYDVWVAQGNAGTEADFLASLVGAQGETGTTGPIGPVGPIGPAGPAGPQGEPYAGSAGDNTLVGQNALSNNQLDQVAEQGIQNTAVGSGSLSGNTVGSYNTGVGLAALTNNVSGIDNVAVGYSSLFTNTTGTRLTALGNDTDVTQDGLINATVVGMGGRVRDSDTMQFGNTEITDVFFGRRSDQAGNMRSADLHTQGQLVSGEVTYPNTDGTAGQVLTTDGSGGLAWTFAPYSLLVLDANASVVGQYQDSSDYVYFRVAGETKVRRGQVSLSGDGDSQTVDFGGVGELIFASNDCTGTPRIRNVNAFWNDWSSGPNGEIYASDGVSTFANMGSRWNFVEGCKAQSVSNATGTGTQQIGNSLADLGFTAPFSIAINN